MITVRRWYMFLVSGISLNAVVWAIIALLRNLFVSGINAPETQLAFEIAVVVIGMPFFLAHWLWIRRLALEQGEERVSILRQFYLYAMMSGFLAPFVANITSMTGALLSRFLDVTRPGSAIYDLDASEAFIYHLVAVAVLALFWEYHRRQVISDGQEAGISIVQADPRRIYIYGFSAVGLIMTATSTSYLMRALLFQIGHTSIASTHNLTANIHQLIVGLPLWIIFWMWAGRLYEGPEPAEQRSALRKLYLYLSIFGGVILVVVNVTLILASGLRQLLDLPSVGDIREPLPLIFVGAILWVYHAQTLRSDALAAPELPQQGGIRRLYYYLLAGIGLMAMLIGLSGDISVLIHSLSGRPFITTTREQLAWFTAVLMVGLPVWSWPWRQSQLAVDRSQMSGDGERNSIVRRIYLYLFLFIAAVGLLSSGIYIVSQLIELALGARAARFLASDLAQAIAFALIAGSVWIYHFAIVRSDGRHLAEAESGLLANLQLVFADQGDTLLATDILNKLKQEIPQVSYQTIRMTASKAATELDLEALQQADVIVGAWTMAAEHNVGQEWAAAVARSPARKLLIPAHNSGWDWVGVKRETLDKTTKQLVSAIGQIAADEEIAPPTALGLGTIVAIIVGIFILLSVLIPLVIFLLEELF